MSPSKLRYCAPCARRVMPSHNDTCPNCGADLTDAPAGASPPPLPPLRSTVAPPLPKPPPSTLRKILIRILLISGICVAAFSFLFTCWVLFRADQKMKARSAAQSEAGRRKTAYEAEALWEAAQAASKEARSGTPEWREALKRHREEYKKNNPPPPSP